MEFLRRLCTPDAGLSDRRLIGYLTAMALGFSAQPCFALSKKEAVTELMSNSPKWRLTQSLPIEAESKLEEAQSKTRPTIGFAITQYAARINPIQFGVDQEPTDLIGFGSTGFEMRWALMDPIASFEKLGSQAQLDISKGQSRQYQTDLTALMLIQYLTVQKLGAQIENLKVSSQRGLEILKFAKMKKSIGAGIPLDIARAQSLTDLDRIKQIQLQVRYDKAIDDLAILLGRDELKETFDPLNFSEIQPAKVQSLLTRATEFRGDLQGATAAVAAANKMSADAQGVFFPKVSVLGNVGTTRASWLGLPPDRLTGFVGARLEVPLSTGGFIEAKRQEAAALSMKAESQARQTRLEFQNQIKEAAEQIQAATDAVHASQAYVKSSREEADLIEKKFRVGSGGVLDVLNASNGAASARDTEIDAIFAFESAKISLFRTVGNFDDYF